ncbi:MAG TPA: VWA domain-containing protein [Candidatus Angelobacter sp.]
MSSRSICCVLLVIAITSVVPVCVPAQEAPATQPASMHSSSDQKPASDLAVLARVTDSKGRPTPDLKAENFILTEDGKPLPVKSVQISDAPACVGLMLDRSGSMRSKNSAAINALMGFVRASNPADQFFAVNFNDDPYLDQDLTSDANSIQQAFDRHAPRGGTALYDAVIASATHVMGKNDCKRKVLVALTDGGDNESRKSLSQVVGYLEKMKGLSIYIVMITDYDANVHASRKAIETLVAPVNGEALFVNLNKLDKTFQEIALALRTEYLITYEPREPGSSDTIKRLNVSARSRDIKDLRVQVVSAEMVPTSAAGAK